MNILEYCKSNVKENYEKMLDIIYLYYKTDDITDFKLDLQLYSQEYKSEPRIWLINKNNKLGINLMLYSIKLCSYDEILKNEDAIDVFSEYMRFYYKNKELFTLWKNKNDDWKPTASITFGISNRE